MTDLEKVELAIRRVQGQYGSNSTHDGDLIANALERLADEIAHIIKEDKQ